MLGRGPSSLPGPATDATPPGKRVDLAPAVFATAATERLLMAGAIEVGIVVGG